MFVVLSAGTKIFGDDFILDISFFIFVWNLSLMSLNFIDGIISSKTFWEVFVKQTQEFFNYIGGDISAEWWVKPNDISVACSF